MTLLYRIKRLIKADAYAMVEGLEEPKWILAQSIRDMEEELDKSSSVLLEKKGKLESFIKQIHTIKLDQKNMDNDIELALGEKREDIAKVLIKKLLLSKKSLELLLEQSEQYQKDVNNLEKEYDEKKQVFDDICIRSETKIFPARDDCFDEAKGIVRQDCSLEHEVELEFLRRLKKKKGGQDE